MLRTVWCVTKTPLGSSGNTRPDYQQLLSNIETLIWCESSQESSRGGAQAWRSGSRRHLNRRKPSTASADSPLAKARILSMRSASSTTALVRRLPQEKARSFLLHPTGRMTLPVWVDHVGSAGTRYETGDLSECDLAPPPIDHMPQIRPPD